MSTPQPRTVLNANLSEVERKVLAAVNKGGALTIRSVIQRYGLAPNWSRLLEWNFLTKTETIYGSVLTLSAATRETIQAKSQELKHLELKLKLPYLMGPGAIVDRAYQQDAFARLKSEGYRFLRHTYKQRGDMRKSSSRRIPTDQIVSSTLRVPDSEAAVLEAMWGFHVFQLDEVAPHDDSHRLGYPMLYATISGGGIQVKRVQALLRIHSMAIGEWRSPLLVVVPDLTPFRDLQRVLDARQDIELRKGRAAVPRNFIGTYSELRLIEQSLPLRGRSG